MYKLEEKSKDNSPVVKSNMGGWHSDDLYGDVSENFNKLKKIISDFFSKKVLNIDGVIEPTKLWTNINKKHNYNQAHLHGKTTYYSGVYYVKVPKNSGNLYFLNYTHWRPISISEYPDIYKYEDLTKEIEMESKEGDLYFFKGKLAHRVGRNMSDEDRISISFNFNLDDMSQQIEEKDIKWG